MSILEKAEAAVNGPRNVDYGHPRENIERIRERWSQVLGMHLTAQQVCLMMIDLKCARLVNDPAHYDSWMDIAGYVRVMEMTSE